MKRLRLAALALVLVTAGAAACTRVVNLDPPATDATIADASIGDATSADGGAARDGQSIDPDARTALDASIADAH